MEMFRVKTSRRTQLVDVTRQVERAVEEASQDSSKEDSTNADFGSTKKQVAVVMFLRYYNRKNNVTHSCF